MLLGPYFKRSLPKCDSEVSLVISNMNFPFVIYVLLIYTFENTAANKIGEFSTFPFTFFPPFPNLTLIFSSDTDLYTTPFSISVISGSSFIL